MVEEFYWFGGFGDRAYIGWIPIEEWRGVTEEEVAIARLVGEKGYKGDGQEFVTKGDKGSEKCGPKCRREEAFPETRTRWQ